MSSWLFVPRANRAFLCEELFDLSFTYLDIRLLFAICAADLKHVVEAIVVAVFNGHCQEGLHRDFFDTLIRLSFFITFTKCHTFRVRVAAIVPLPAIYDIEFAFVL